MNRYEYLLRVTYLLSGIKFLHKPKIARNYYTSPIFSICAVNDGNISIVQLEPGSHRTDNVKEQFQRERSVSRDRNMNHLVLKWDGIVFGGLNDTSQKGT
jgi:hypothetical protein